MSPTQQPCVTQLWSQTQETDAARLLTEHPRSTEEGKRLELQPDSTQGNTLNEHSQTQPMINVMSRFGGLKLWKLLQEFWWGAVTSPGVRPRSCGAALKGGRWPRAPPLPREDWHPRLRAAGWWWGKTLQNTHGISRGGGSLRNCQKVKLQLLGKAAN